MNKTAWIIIIIIIVVAIGALWLGASQPVAPEPTPTDDTGVTTSPTQVDQLDQPQAITTEEATTTDSELKSFTVSGRLYSFTPDEIHVNLGDRVRIIFNSEQGTHDWVVDEFNARTKILPAGEGDEIEFVANKVGTFEYYCSVGDHRARGMVGKLIIEG